MTDEAASSRRAVLLAALGALGATVANAITTPPRVRAGSDGDVVLGASNYTTTPTGILKTSADIQDTLTLTTAGSGRGLYIESTSGSGLHASANATSGQLVGVEGLSASPDGYGVQGRNVAASGGAGVAGYAFGTFGESAGVQGQATSPQGYGVLGDNIGAGANARGMVGHAPDGTGVLGWAGTGTAPAGRASTGVYGRAAAGGSSVGVYGESPAGSGGQFVSTTGNALRVSGKARFNRAGKTSVPARASYVDVTVPGGLASNSLVLATIQTYRAGVAVAGVRPNHPSTGKARIYLTKVASTTASTPVAWQVIEYGS